MKCIQVDNESVANNNQTPYDAWIKDATTFYSEDCQAALSVDDELLEQVIKFYPNPVTNVLTIDSEIPLTKVEIYSVLGKKVEEVNSDFRSISTNNLSSGIYMVKIYSEKGTTVRKLIKQ